MGKFKDLEIDSFKESYDQWLNAMENVSANMPDVATGEDLTNIGLQHRIQRFSYETDEIFRNRLLATIKAATNNPNIVAQEEYPYDFSHDSNPPPVRTDANGNPLRSYDLDGVSFDDVMPKFEQPMSHCQHEPARYEGLFEVFNYCKKCDKKL